MIDFNSYETFKLEDVADYERAKHGYIYPAGTSTIQISATSGEIGFLTHRSTIEPKYTAIIPQAGINPRYFNFVMQKNVKWFIHKYVAYMNIQVADLACFPIELHNLETQNAIAAALTYLDDGQDKVAKQVTNLQEMQRYFLNRMMV